jgi:2Fe-2S ferredoxin
MPRLTFVLKDGSRQELEVSAGLTLLEVARRHDIDIEGACEGSLACSTCHVVVAPEWFDRLPLPSEDEDDMLDLAFGLTRTSRLGCQVVITDEFDGLTVALPEAARDVMFDKKAS